MESVRNLLSRPSDGVSREAPARLPARGLHALCARLSRRTAGNLPESGQVRKGPPGASNLLWPGIPDIFPGARKFRQALTVPCFFPTFGCRQEQFRCLDYTGKDMFLYMARTWLCAKVVNS